MRIGADASTTAGADAGLRQCVERARGGHVRPKLPLHMRRQDLLVDERGGRNAAGCVRQEQGRSRFPDGVLAVLALGEDKDAGDNRVSSKRGVAIQNKKLTEASLTSLAPVVSWSYGWAYKATIGAGGATLGVSSFDGKGIQWLPMIWDGNGLTFAESELGSLDWGATSSKALLGFNEPNYREQANLSPADAAAMWPRLEMMAAQKGITKLVSPAMAFGGWQQGPDWLGEFLERCVGCKIDAIALHSYTCYARFLQDHINVYRSFGKPLWLTEFACAEGG
eukprot:CAMPEP_0203855474 /NCGR_PEP_ID=MMETSP0359-20131031/9659_1 /ASSEMBLY_ACC=CAM_ASM_000338 /TAXON_ID=268821 /ORGANISM="Scrippsiella Hangoei, Strain SHTV-5" /LENGTH=279 /DNA_ID=CAMNT_0050772023 /DNA_START=70 /DNA_END=907 /DNA_ORIENTATION=-